MARSVASFRRGSVAYLQTGDHHSDMASQRPMNVRYENTYRVEPNTNFPYLASRDIIRDVLQTTFGDTTKYDPLTVSQLAADAANELRARVKVSTPGGVRGCEGWQKVIEMSYNWWDVDPIM